ncbi:MAG: YggT family protein [Deltaproteobacteria bacterium]|nr:YggT family protein [Deltaproteobacteria bacterium]
MLPVDGGFNPESSVLISLSSLVWWLVYIYIWVIIIRVLISWFHPNRQAPFVAFLRKVADPPLNFTRRLCPFTFGGMDLSPIILILFLHFLANFLKNSLITLGIGLPATKIIPVLVICLLGVVNSLAWFVFLLLVARVILSLVDPSPYNPLVMMVYGLTEPLLAPLRGLFSKGPAGLDVRALVAAIGLFVFNQFILLKLLGVANAWYLSRPVTASIF